MTAPNAELAYMVLDHIDAHPEQWDQGAYIGRAECGTVGCFAGWAVLLSGDEPVFHDGAQAADGVLVDGLVVMVSHRAAELLRASRFIGEGGEGEQDLFDQFNTREDLGRLVAEIFGPRPQASAAAHRPGLVARTGGAR